MERTSITSLIKSLGLGVLLLLFALIAAYLIYLINRAYPNQPESAAMIVGVLFIVLFVLPPTVYLFFQRRSTNPWKLGLIVIATISVLLVAIYVYRISSYVLFPSDILLWSESDFVNDILKFRIGYPIYSDPVNNESFYYTPGAQLVTYLLTWLVGAPTSIPLYRIIQLIYVLIATIVAAFCLRRLLEISLLGYRIRVWRMWSVVCLPIFFLMATNSVTNEFVYFLHHDSLALLVSIIAYWLLLEYAFAGKRRVLILMAIIPAIGFFVKQSLTIWAPLYCAYLVFFDRPRSLSRVAKFTLVSFGLIGAVIGFCYLVWGEHFIYWIFALGKDGISPLRSVQHILDAWIYLAIGLLSGFILLRGKHFNLLLGLWLVWLSLILIEGYTSGIGWMRNHLGPGSLIGGIWFLATLIRIWPSTPESMVSGSGLHRWLRAGIAVMAIGLIFNGLGLVRIPVNPISSDAYRYVKEIEREFEGQAAGNILLDAGTWIYLKERVVMMDRALPIADRGYSGVADFSGIIKRLKQKRYSKILVRNLHSPEFLYDHWMWPKSSGIRKIMLEEYHEIGKIKAVQETRHNKHPFYFFDEISILVPNLH